ncbi:MAG: stage III sporulation protein SpoIIIAB [Clostridia bacterium]
MIIKTLGCLLIIGSSISMGFYASNKYAKRPEELRALQSALQMLESEIAFSLNPIPEAFERISVYVPGNIKQIFEQTSYLLKQRTGMTAKEAWKLSVDKAASNMNLQRQDKEILISFGSSLGSSDTESQLKNIHLACSKLSMEEKNAEILREKNEKLCKNLGVLGGILVSLLFL